MKFLSQQGIDHLNERIYIQWDITTICQLDCSYCNAKSQYKNNWQVPGILKKQLQVIDELEKSTLPVFLVLLGGEPTLHHHIDKLINEISTRILKHKDSRLIITTNGLTKSEFFQNQPLSNGKIYYLWSWHAEYMNIDSFNLFYKNIKIIEKKGYKGKINLMLHPAKKYWDFTKECYYKLATLENISLHPQFIYFGNGNDTNYSDDFYEYFNFLTSSERKEFEYKTKNEILLFSDYDIFKNNFNEFKGWKCWHNNFKIKNDCTIDDICFQEISKSIPFNFFKNITKIEPKICPHNFCSCDGLLKIHKENICH